MDSFINGGKPYSAAVFRRDGSARTAGAIAVDEGGYSIADTATTAKVGDIYRAETATVAAMVGKEYKVIKASTNSFTIASKDLPTVGDTFYILAPTSTRVGSDGAIAVSLAGGATEAKQDAEIVLIGALTETAPGTDTASSGLNGRLQRIAQRLTSLIALVPASLGSKAAASSFAVTDSTEDIARMGIITETAPASDTASSGINGRLQRIAQRLTSLIGLLPTALGSAAASASLAVTQSTEDVARVGIITETAPASDTASSGLNGRLQRIAQRITSLIALVPASLGAKAAASSFAVTLATEDTATLNTLLKPANTLAGVTTVTTVSTVSSVTAIANALPAGNNNIGDVDVASIAAGTNIIGYTIPTPVTNNTNAMSSAASTAYATNLVIKGSAGRLYQLTGYNSKASSQFIQIHNTTSLPSDTAVPIFTFLVPPSTSFSLDFFPMGRYFSTGIVVCNSSTGATKTVGSSDCWFNAEYL